MKTRFVGWIIALNYYHYYFGQPSNESENLKVELFIYLLLCRAHMSGPQDLYIALVKSVIQLMTNFYSQAM